MIRVPSERLSAWAAGALEAAGASSEHAAVTARVLVAADVRGIESHGVARLPAYVAALRSGFVSSRGRPRIARRSGAVAVVDAKNLLGPVGAEFSMHAACDLAQRHGIGWVTVRNSNHFGIAGYYVELAVGRRLIGLAGSNASTLVAPTRAAAPFLGTNPLAFAAPTLDGPPLVLDMSTSAVSGGKFELAQRGDRRVPRGWGLTLEAADTEDAGVYGAGGMLLPLGSFEELSSYKGYGLALMVEVLAATLAAGPHGPDVGPLTSSTQRDVAGVSHFFCALDPGVFGGYDAVAHDIASLCERLRALPRRDSAYAVLTPGEREWRERVEREARGIPITAPIAKELAELGEELALGPF